ncbi:MAG TPA: hypothetical protein ENI85_15820 [Deltaproteobacteria bacterium]|nr:hypothetical protein [Deltaproteobacteria bacterium]
MKIVIRRFLISARMGLLLVTVPACLALTVPTMGHASALEKVGEGAAVGFDIAVLRTLGSLRLIVGAAALIPATMITTLTLPFNRDPGQYREVADTLVVGPANYVFRRPLGEDFAGE